MLAGHLLATFNHDIFITLLNHVADDVCRAKLEKFSAAFLQHADTAEGGTWLSKDRIGEHLREAFMEAVVFHKLVCNLLQVQTGSTLSEHDVLHFDKYKGPCSFKRAVKSLMTTPEPEGGSPIKIKSREMLKSCRLEILKTAGTATQGTATIQTLISQLQGCAKDLQPGCCVILAGILNQRDQLRGQVRKGPMKQLDETAVSFSKDMAEKARTH